MHWVRTKDRLPRSEESVELLGYGDNISGHVDGRYSIMRYDGVCWWNEDGTEMSDPPEFWTYIDPPNQSGK